MWLIPKGGSCGGVPVIPYSLKFKPFIPYSLTFKPFIPYSLNIWIIPYSLKPILMCGNNDYLVRKWQSEYTFFGCCRPFPAFSCIFSSGLLQMDMRGEGLSSEAGLGYHPQEILFFWHAIWQVLVRTESCFGRQKNLKKISIWSFSGPFSIIKFRCEAEHEGRGPVFGRGFGVRPPRNFGFWHAFLHILVCSEGRCFGRERNLKY